MLQNHSLTRLDRVAIGRLNLVAWTAVVQLGEVNHWVAFPASVRRPQRIPEASGGLRQEAGSGF